MSHQDLPQTQQQTSLADVPFVDLVANAVNSVDTDTVRNIANEYSSFVKTKTAEIVNAVRSKPVVTKLFGNAKLLLVVGLMFALSPISTAMVAIVAWFVLTM
jgi:hypothetical protein